MWIVDWSGWLAVMFAYRHLVGFCLALRENANNLMIKFGSDLSSPAALIE